MERPLRLFSVAALLSVAPAGQAAAKGVKMKRQFIAGNTHVTGMEEQLAVSVKYDRMSMNLKMAWQEMPFNSYRRAVYDLAAQMLKLGMKKTGNFEGKVTFDAVLGYERRMDYPMAVNLSVKSPADPKARMTIPIKQRSVQNLKSVK